MGFILGFVGFVLLLLGAFCFVGAAMPTFGGRNDPVTPMVCGGVLLVAGAALLVYAGLGYE